MSKDRKICPLSRYGNECLQKKCAWWDGLAKNCAILVIAHLGSEGSSYALRQEIKGGGGKVTLGELLIGKEEHEKQMERIKKEEGKK